MKEQRITVTINEDGSLDLKTDGIKGEACLSEVEEILDELADIKEVKKTDEYYQKVNVSQKILIFKNSHRNACGEEKK